jgi:hypothetical protein
MKIPARREEGYYSCSFKNMRDLTPISRCKIPHSQGVGVRSLPRIWPMIYIHDNLHLIIRIGKTLMWATFPIAKIVGWLAALCPKHQSIEQTPKRNK